MNFNSYIVSETKTAFSIPLSEVLVSKKTFKQKAFTLAETLITLSIIGVVAAMTVPTLITNAQKTSYVAGLKKAYSQLQNAIKMMPINENCNQGDLECAGYYEENECQWLASDVDGKQFDGDWNKKRMYLLSKQFKTQKLCFTPNTNDKNCPANYEKFGMEMHIPYFLTEDGMQYLTYESSIGVDVNGFKGPNKLGVDLFYFAVPADCNKENGYFANYPVGTVIPYGTSDTAGDTHWKHVDCKNGNYIERMSCTARVLKTGKIDY